MNKVRNILVIIVLVLIIITTGCGNLSKYAGTYHGVYMKYVGDEDTAKSEEEFSLVLEANGTGKSNRDGGSYNITWSCDGENIKITEKFLTLTIEYNGTIKDGKIDLFNGDPSGELTLELVYEKK